jgi:DNA-binding NtrC family response regulator
MRESLHDKARTTRYPVAMREGPEVVAIINTSRDIVDMLRITLQYAGVVVVSALTNEIRDGEVNLEAFIRQHEPKVIVYDVAPPYEANWLLFQHMRQMPVMAGRYFVLTSTNKRHLEALAGPDMHIYEIVGKPVDLDAIVQAVREALKARPTRH